MSCEILIIGSGPGGATIADQMLKYGKDVLMLEEGATASYRDMESPMSNLQNLWRGNGLTVAIGKSPVSYAEGRCVGGGSEINSAIIQRAPSHLLDEWAQRYEIESFNSRDLEPFYEWAFDKIGAKFTPDESNSLSRVMLKGANRLNWKIAPLERAEDKQDGKRSMSATLLKEALLSGLRLKTGCRVMSLGINESKAQFALARVTGDDGKETHMKIFFKSVFIAAGAIQTPALLLRSSIIKNVGRSLRMHPTIKALASFDETMTGVKDYLAPYAVTEFMPNIRLGCSVYRPAFFGMSLAEDWASRSHLSNSMNNCGIYYSMVRAQGIGRIYSVPGSLNPLVTYKLTKGDWANLRSGLLSLAELLFSADATEIFPSLSRHAGWKNIGDAKTDATLNHLEKFSNPFTIHIFSSCPMGENLDYCAVDSFGKVHGMENVFIADASLIPEAPGVNPQATIMALAKRNAENFLERN